MALQINKTFDNGIVASECYVKVSIVEYLLEEVHLTVSYYFNEAARTDSISKTFAHSVFEISSLDIETREDQYNYLKTLDEFSEALDV